MATNARQLYWVAAVLALVSSILQLTAREWFRGATGLVLAIIMALAATGFPEKSAANKRLYFVLLGVVIVMLIAQIYLRVTAPD